MVNRPRIRSVLFATAVIGVAACSLEEKTVAPEPHLLVVHAILDLGSTIQHIDLTYSDKSQSCCSMDTTFRSAIVTVTTPEGVVMTGKRDSVYDPSTKRYYPVPGLTIKPGDYGVTLVPGATYSLRVQTATGDTVTGTTTVPQATPVSMSQGDLFHRDTDTLHLSWKSVSGAAAYYITFDQMVREPPDTFYNSRYSRFAFGPVDFPGNASEDFDGNKIFDAYCSSCAAAIELVTTVSAVDTNYYQYYRQPGDPFTAALPSRLKGGIGVFGSLVPIYWKHYTVR